MQFAQYFTCSLFHISILIQTKRTWLDMRQVKEVSSQLKLLVLWLVLSMFVKEATSVSCQTQYIAPTLYNRMFPVTVINPQDIKTPSPVPNSNCSFSMSRDTLVITNGDDSSMKCNDLPPNTTEHGFGRNTSHIKHLVVQTTHIVSFEPYVFSTWSNIEVLEISMNRHLISIRPGAFRNLTKVWNLTMSDNPHLGSLDPNCFTGLDNLMGLRYLRNNVSEVRKISASLRPCVLPKLTVLDLTGNNIVHIDKDEFEPMRGSRLNTLVITLCKTNWIHEEALDPLGPLHRLVLGRNNLNTTISSNVLNRATRRDVNLNSVSLAENALSVDPGPILQAVAGNNRLLELQDNHFGVLPPATFPYMPNIRIIDLTNVMIDDLQEGVFDSTMLPLLEHVYLGQNIFSGLKSSMVQETFSRLDISYNENDLPWNTLFQIEPGIFAKMPRLTLLNMSGNKLGILSKYTLSNTTALKVLLLRSSSISEIEQGAFQSCHRLFYLDLSDNIFPVVNPFTREIFRGLRELLALDLSRCGIYTIPNDLFYHTPNLQYLSLRSNSLYQINPGVFHPLLHLNVIDLRYNILVDWNERLITTNFCLNKTMLDYNHLQGISQAMLEDFAMFKTVNLYANSIVCDCLLLNTVRTQIKSSEDVTSLSFSGTLNMCINIREPLVEFLQRVGSGKCVTTNWIAISIIVLVSLLLFSAVSYIVYYYYKYDIHFWFVRVKRRLGLLHYIGNGKMERSGEFKYDAFVSYSVEDEKFVEKMVYILEKDCSRFNLCVFERDFQVGDVLTDRILECMESSRRTILVLTESFAKSQWCCWEMYMAQSRSIALRDSDPNDPLILIKKSEIPETLMTPILRYLMRTRVYLEWNDNPAKQKLFWEQLKNSLRIEEPATA